MTLDTSSDHVHTSALFFCPVCQRPQPIYTRPYPTYANTLKMHCAQCRTFIGTAWKEAPHGETAGPGRESVCCEG